MNKKETLTIPLTDLVEDASLPDPAMYQYYKQLKNRRIVINSEIDDTPIRICSYSIYGNG